MKTMKKLHQEYTQINVPNDLDDFMDECIQQAKKAQQTSYRRKRWKYAATLAMASYLIVLNVVPAFAKTMFDIPFLGDVSRILCIRSYHVESDVDSLDVKMPVIQNTGNPMMEKRVNQKIEEKIQATIIQLHKESEEVRSMLAKQKDDVHVKTQVSIDYSITCNKQYLLSFQVLTTYQLNTSMQEYQTFNLDLLRGRDITLKDLFGEDYEEIINAEIIRQINERMKEDDSLTYFIEDPEFQGIQKTQPFYINEQGEVVIIFEKYTIAPGYMGTQEFHIPCDAIAFYTGD